MLRNLLTATAVECMERGWVPDSLIRKGIASLCRQRLNQQQVNVDGMSRLLSESKHGPIAPLPEKANEQHYEVPQSFFGRVLGPHRKYSCCYWSPGETSLERAEAEALRRTCENARIEDGMEILELGCGWGSLTLWLAQHYPNASVTAVSNSSSQRKYIMAEAARRGIDRNLRVFTADMNDFHSDRKHDRIVSVEMFEHMRNHQELLRRIASWLTPGGKLLVHVFCHREFAYPFETEGAANWMGRHFFTGGLMPSEDLLPNYDQDLGVERQWRWSGDHYQKTADAWLELIDRRKDEVQGIFARTYGPEDADRWLQRWRIFFLAVSELFGYAGGQEWFVAHYLMSPAARGAARQRAPHDVASRPSALTS